MRFVGKIIMLTFNDTEEKAVEKAIAVLTASPGRVFIKQMPILLFLPKFYANIV